MNPMDRDLARALDAFAVPPLPAAVQALLAAGGLIPFLQQHPDWSLAGRAA